MVYKEGEIVLCYSGELPYQAKILKVQHSQAKVKYLVHYAGWKSRYDEWVEETRILAHTEKNVQEAARLRDAAVKKGEKAAAGGGESTAGKKRRIDAAADTEDAAEDAASFKLRYTVPFALKRALVDDWENVTQKQLLFRLPARAGTTVADIARDFIAHLEQRGGSGSDAAAGAAAAVASPPPKKGGAGAAAGAAAAAAATAASDAAAAADELRAARESLEGLLAFFERSLPVLLLYRFERAYVDALGLRPDGSGGVATLGGAPPSQVCGGVHLLRLLARLPDVAEGAALASEEGAALSACATDLLKFLSSRAAQYMPADAYAKASADYCRLADGGGGGGGAAAGKGAKARGGGAAAAMAFFEEGGAAK